MRDWGLRRELDELVRARGTSSEIHDASSPGRRPGPQEIAELDQIRADLEDSKTTLEQLRFVLASALFVGEPEREPKRSCH